RPEGRHEFLEDTDLTPVALCPQASEHGLTSEQVILCDPLPNLLGIWIQLGGALRPRRRLDRRSQHLAHTSARHAQLPGNRAHGLAPHGILPSGIHGPTPHHRPSLSPDWHLRKKRLGGGSFLTGSLGDHFTPASTCNLARGYGTAPCIGAGVSS